MRCFHRRGMVTDEEVQLEIGALASRLQRITDAEELSQACGRLVKRLGEIGVTRKQKADAIGGVFRALIATAKRHGILLSGFCSELCRDCEGTCKCGCS